MPWNTDPNDVMSEHEFEQDERDTATSANRPLPTVEECLRAEYNFERAAQPRIAPEFPYGGPLPR